MQRGAVVPFGVKVIQRFLKAIGVSIADRLQGCERSFGVTQRVVLTSVDEGMQRVLSPALRLLSFCKMETAWLTMSEMFFNWASKVAMRAAPAFCASASDAAMFSRSAAILGSCNDCAPRDFVTR